MFKKFSLLLVIGLSGLIVTSWSNRASAIVPLTRAQIQNLRNFVQLIPQNSAKKRPARKLDAMIPGDGLSTGRASLADLRFNDGSLARIGEQAVFQFLPRTRNFRLSNGTVLLLIPPGRGQTRIQTPSAAAAIRGSALFVRYNQQTDTTIVGALTNSGIEVFNKEASQSRVLEAGQLIVIVKGEFQSLYDFDLRNFYETSDLVRELDLNRQNPVPTHDLAITSVQAETAAALKAQPPITGKEVIENPSFVQLTSSPSNSPNNNVVTGNSSTNSSEKTGQSSTNTNSNNSNVNSQNNNTGVDSSKTSTESQPSSQQSNPSTGTVTTPEATPSQPTTTPEATPSQPTTTPEATPSQPTTTPEVTPSQPTTTPEVTPSQPTTTPEVTPSQPTTTPEVTPSQPTTTPEVTPSQPTTTPEVTPSQPTTTPEVTPSQPTTTPEVTPTQPTTTPEASQVPST